MRNCGAVYYATALGLDLDSRAIDTFGFGGMTICVGAMSGWPYARLLKYRFTQLRTNWSVPS